MIRSWRLASAALLALLLLFVLNLGVMELERHSSKQTLVNALRQPGDVMGLFSGNSLVEIGVDTSAFAKSCPASPTPSEFRNCGLGDTSTVEHCVVLRDALRHHPETQFVVYGFAGDQLTDLPDGSWGALRANRTVSYYLEPDLAARLYGGSRLDRLRFDWLRFVPLAAERYLLWNRVELLRRKLESIGVKGADSSRYGRVSDFQSLEENWSQSALAQCRHAVVAQAPLSPAIAELLRSAGEGGRRVYVVEMPLPPAYERLVDQTGDWHLYRDYVRALVARAGARYIDAHDWVTAPDEFLDAIHLNPAGAARFSTRLAQELVQTPR